MMKQILKDRNLVIQQIKPNLRIKNHRKAAKHLLAASKFYFEAASHHEEGNHQKAEQSTIAAHGQVTLSNKAQKAGIKHHAIIS